MLTGLEGKSWDDIKEDPDLAGKLLNETQRTTVLRGWKDKEVLYEIFYRLNSGSVKLSPMELRMSLFPGEFLKFIVRWTETIGPVHHLLKKRIPDPRMGDVELAVRYLAFSDPSIKYSGDLKRFLDTVCKNYNRDFIDSAFKKLIESKLDELNEAINAGIEIFGVNCFCRKFQNGKYESRFNRAILDVLGGSLSNQSVRTWALANPNIFKEAYEALSLDSPTFTRAVEVTTKSLESTRTRFELWYASVRSISGIKIKTPKIAA